MKRRLPVLALCLSPVPGPAVMAQAPASAAPSAATAAGPPITRLPDAPAAVAPGAPEPARFTTDAKWQIAGYNDEEIVYTIIITNQDARILHCNAELHGFYYDNGVRRSISDRAGTTIFPGRQANVGHWLGMDQKSGATYKVTCRPMGTG